MSSNQTSNKSAAVSQITTHPALAIIGVLLGALTSVFTGRLLSIGLADVQGAIGASSDYMTYITTAFNAANMFIGPLTVFMGAILGARRVLLWASAIFILAEFLSPFATHNPLVFLVLQTIAGLAAGTYYPLTFTIIIRNFSLKYLYLGLAIYALDILASTNIAHLVESFYITHLSWQWIFWNALLPAPIMMFCVYFGIPRQPIAKPKAGMEFWGFLYAAFAFTFIYIGLDQGERLDWLNSPWIAAYFGVGIFLLFATLFSHARKPNPMINLSFLRSRNFLILGFVLVCFRFLLLEPTLLIPSYLALLHNYRPEQTAAVLAWIAVPELLLAPIAGLLLYKVDSRFVCAFGFALVGLSSYASSRLDPAWTGETFLFDQLITAAGLALALTGLIATLLRSALKVGALSNPVNILTISCWFQTCRLFGAEIGKAILSRFLKVQSDFHYSVVSAHINGDWLTNDRLKALTFNNFGAGSGIDDAKVKALIELGGSLKQQVGLLAFSDGFVLVALSAACCILAIGFVSYSPPLVAAKSSK
ncbi:MAG: MFS transporter [Candidatus Obscuribacterales bacterium]|nr:MFS transporter [Candidatus Obscuribacterales bacterium]